MKSNEKRLILILLAITIVVTTILIARNNKNKNNKENGVEKVAQQEVVQIGENGVKQSSSPKLSEIKKVGGIEISNVQIIEQNGLATLIADVKNISTKTKKEFTMKIKLINKSGETIETLGGMCGTIKPDETRGINASIDMDISEIYDIQVEM